MKNLTTIILVRHGETVWNQQNRLQGQMNSALTDVGKQQAVETKNATSHLVLNSAYVSPLLRAKETLNIIIEQRDIRPIIDEGLKEISLGPWEGKTKEETKLSDPIQYNNFWHHQNEFSLIGAETYSDLQNRMVSSLNNIFEKENNNTVLVVSHWMAIKVVVAYFSNISLNELSTCIDISNGGFISLTKTNGHVTVKIA